VTWKKPNVFLFLASLVSLAFIASQGSAHSNEPGGSDGDFRYVISSPEETKDKFSAEPMRTQVRTIDGVNVVYQYDQPVPSFDTWETREEGRNHMTLNGEWRFAKDPENRGVEEQWYSPLYDHSSWEKRYVPGCWDLYDYSPYHVWGEGYPFYDGYAWYVRTFELDDSWLGRYVKLNFLAVNYRCWIYVNGQYVEAHESGHTSFSVDVTKHLKRGTNTVAVRVYRRPDFENYFDLEAAKRVSDLNGLPHAPADYWPYAGITRDVYLEGTDKVTVSKILTNAKNDSLDMFAVICNTDDREREIAVEFDPGSGTGGHRTRESIVVEPGAARVVKQRIAIPDAKEWSYVAPNVYRAFVRLYEGDALIDSLSVAYGMREFKVEGTKVLLNSQQVFLKGTNWHEETKQSGRSMTKEEYDFELGLVKEMNMNFIRNSHYNRHPYAYEYADRHGIMVMDETENMWLDQAAVRNQYRNYGLSRAAVMMTTWNNLNHPSVVIWSLCNEVSYGGDYNSWIKDLRNIAKAIDVQGRPVSWAARDTNDTAFQYADIIGFNEYAGFFWGKNEDLTAVLQGIHRRFPDKPIMITENGSWSAFGVTGSPSQAGSEHWQAANFRSHYSQTVVHKDFMAGYTFWILKDYKTRAGYNFDSIGISTMGTVPWTYNREFRDNALKIGLDPHKAVYYAIQRAENPYTYAVSEEED
jgi:beta-glucuronidase